MKKVHQCKSCPWKTSTVPERDIPRYKLSLARRLGRTIAKSAEDSTRSALSSCPMHVMACHYSNYGEEIPCAGWLHNQLGVGNNIAVRLRVMGGHMPVPEVEGEQHERYEDTLPCEPKKRRRR